MCETVRSAKHSQHKSIRHAALVNTAQLAEALGVVINESLSMPALKHVAGRVDLCESFCVSATVAL
jgi:hypothetical protein